MYAHAALLVSGLLLLAVAWMGARALVAAGAERFWVMVALVALQLGAIFQALSALRILEPAPFLGCQAFLLAGAIWLTRWRRSGQRAADHGGLLTVSTHGSCLRNVCIIPRNPVFILLAISILALMALSAFQQAMTPIHGRDECGYHAPRVLYWLQQRSIAPFDTHNVRQTTFPFLAELFFAWPMLFLKQELPARMVFWTGLPLATIGVYLLARELRVGRRAALGAALLYIATPTIILHGASLKSDLWHPLMVLGSAFFALRAFRGPGNPSQGARANTAGGGAARAWFWSGLFLGLAIAVKTTSLAMLPGLMMAALGVPSLRNGLLRLITPWAWLTVGMAAALVLSGFAMLCAWNVRDHGHPFGAAVFREAVQADISTRQLLTHSARLPLQLLQFPELPAEGVRAWVERQGTVLARRLNADQRLPLEADAGWPGHFRFSTHLRSRAYSLGGLFWLPLLAIALVRLGRERWRRGWMLRGSRVSALVVLQLPLLVAIVFGLRWVVGGPERFWMASYALAVPVIAYYFAIWVRRSALVGALTLLLLIWTVHPMVRTVIERIDVQTRRPMSPSALDGQYASALAVIESPAVLLLIAGQSSKEYALFLPRRGYINRVVPWGWGEFEPERMEQMIEAHAITHIIVENDQMLGFHSHGVDARPYLNWLRTHPRIEEVPMPDPPRPSGNIRAFAIVPDPAP
jgi:hypothetical protein